MSRLSEKLRYGSLGALLVLTLIAGAMPGDGHDLPAQAGARRPASVQGPPSAGPARAAVPMLDPEGLRRDGLAQPEGNPFASKSWRVRPPAPAPQPLAVAVPQPAPAPTAPPLPFAYMGRLIEDATQRPVYFLARGDRLYTVAEGDLIDGTYRVQGVDAGRLALTYLPLNVRQFLPLGSGS
jgi:hypothetical protein